MGVAFADTRLALDPRYVATGIEDHGKVLWGCAVSNSDDVVECTERATKSVGNGHTTRRGSAGGGRPVCSGRERKTLVESIDSGGVAAEDFFVVGGFQAVQGGAWTAPMDYR